MAIFEQVKLALKKTQSTIFDSEIERLIAAALEDMRTTGVKKLDETDPNIIQAAVLYAYANFGEAEHPERYQSGFEALRDRLALNAEYSEVDADD